MGLDYIFNTAFKMNTDTVSHVIGLIHHIPALYGSYNILMDNNFSNDKINHITIFSNLCMMWTAAYFSFDIIYYIKYYWPFQRKKYIDFIIHAIACYITYIYIYESKKYHWYGAAFITWEASTPFLYILCWCSKRNMQRSLLYYINSLCFITTYFTFRIIFGSYVFFGLLWPIISWKFRYIGIILNSLNYWWFSKIIQKLYVNY
jgi:hypothetical protein